jgi:diguanylate cyclase (GGDEF)-like protein
MGLVGDVLPGGIGHGILISVRLDALNVVAGIAMVLLRKRRFLHGRGGLLLATFAMADIAVNIATGVRPPAAYGSFFVLVMVWVGIWYPLGAVVTMSPVMVCAYLAPLLLGAPRAPGAVQAVLVVVPVAVLAGGTIAHYTDRVRRADVSRERLLRDLSREVVTDELTGVGNRRLGEMLLESLEPGDAVAILDVDHFKHVNDTYGHPEGDRLLHELGSFVNASMRGERDAAARMGGEEFMVVMRGAGPEGISTASRLVRLWREGSPLATLSAGVAVHRPKTSSQATYAAADRALYDAKQSGRDRAVLADVAGMAA